MNHKPYPKYKEFRVKSGFFSRKFTTAQITPLLLKDIEFLLRMAYTSFNATIMRLGLRNQNEAHSGGSSFAIINTDSVIPKHKICYINSNNTPQASPLVRRNDAQIGGLISLVPWV